MLCRTSASPTLDRNVFLGLINVACNLHQLDQIHAQIVFNGLHRHLPIVTKLTERFSDFSSNRRAGKLAFSIPNPDLFLFNVLIRGYSQSNGGRSAVSLYQHLRRNTSLIPNNFTYSFTILGCSTLLDEKISALLHAHSIVDGLGLDLFVTTAAIEVYLRHSQVVIPRKMFDRVSERDTVLWNTMISGLIRNDHFEESLNVFTDMLLNGEKLDSISLSSVLPAVAELKKLKFGKALQSLAIKSGLHYHIYILTGLISLYSKSQDISTAKMLFEQIRKPDLISYNAMIASYSCNGDISSSVNLFKELLNSGGGANSSTLVGLIPLSCPYGHLLLSQCIHGFCLKTGTVSNSSVSTALITVYCRLDELKSARHLFDLISDRNLESWNAMISGYTQNGLTESAISLFREMQACDVNPSPLTVSSILSACAQLGTLSLGKWVHNLVEKEQFESNIYVSTALIDMYSKCGKLHDAFQLFHEMPEKNVVTWGAMISGFGLHGFGHEAVGLFGEMLHSGVVPTSVTFLSVLYACSHAGLVKEGEELFNLMVHDYNINPSDEHYACMVDLFGRAGLLNRAMNFIEGLPAELGPTVWGALLGACKIHKNTAMAEMVSAKLLELDHDDAGYYVLMSNICSINKNYQHAASIREVAKNRKLDKTPGCSLIEVGEELHVFKCDDWSHSQASAIYVMLEKLEAKMKEFGFQTEIVSALHDVEDEEKEIIVKVHSERIAIAFGLIACDPTTEIRIFKNLRVCIDCHNAAKFISKITSRTIVVRDANRFHHFQNGVCSCKDYW